jgi:uncharacterized protein YukE
MSGVVIMAYESDVRQQTRILSDCVLNAKNERNKVKSIVDNANQWWKGKGSETFINEYMNIDSDVGRLLKSIDSAVNNMNRLPALIERAERERREEIARQAATGKK